jgi:hypothetical protein
MLGAIDNRDLARAQSVAVFTRCQMQTGTRVSKNLSNAIGHFLTSEIAQTL